MNERALLRTLAAFDDDQENRVAIADERSALSTNDMPAAASRRGPWATMWHRNPAVRSVDQLTVGGRAADVTRNGMGSWTFVFGALAFLAIWIATNVLFARTGGHPFDAYPFILLNLCLSCLAAMQGAILLIAAKRSDQIASELAAHVVLGERSPAVGSPRWVDDRAAAAIEGRP